MVRLDQLDYQVHWGSLDLAETMEKTVMTELLVCLAWTVTMELVVSQVIQVHVA